MSDIVESPVDIVDASAPVPLGGQPFANVVQSVDEHHDQRTVAQETAKIALQKILEIAEVELANLPYSSASKALGSVRSHLNFCVSQTRYILDTLPL